MSIVLFSRLSLRSSPLTIMSAKVSAKETPRAPYKYWSQSFPYRLTSAVFPGLWRRGSTPLVSLPSLSQVSALLTLSFLLYDHLGPEKRTCYFYLRPWTWSAHYALSLSTIIFTNLILINAPCLMTLELRLFLDPSASTSLPHHVPPF